MDGGRAEHFLFAGAELGCGSMGAGATLSSPLGPPDPGLPSSTQTSSRPPPETPFPSSFLPNRLTASAQTTDESSSNLFVVTSIFRSPAAKLTQMKTTVASVGHTTGTVELLGGWGLCPPLSPHWWETSGARRKGHHGGK